MTRTAHDSLMTSPGRTPSGRGYFASPNDFLSMHPSCALLPVPYLIAYVTLYFILLDNLIILMRYEFHIQLKNDYPNN